MLIPQLVLLFAAGAPRRVFHEHAEVSYCHSFRSLSRAGSYSDRRAVEDANEHLRLSRFAQDNGYGKFQGYDVGLIAPCKAKNIDRDITADVASLATPLYQKAK